jgi:asparagine synthase (glutamine-hydrolysing)
VCGIFGILNADSAGISNDAARGCLELLAARGPDDQGWYEDEHVVLGHRRLTIMDLSAAGRQPMCNEDGSVWIVFNGEIYGFRELRDELQRLGHRFRSTADTEVILHGYEEWGRQVLGRIDGMFAFALWDRNKHLLLLARDRLGKKPLFVARRRSAIAFASQLRPLVASGIVRPVVRFDSLREYLFLNYVTGPKTIFEDAELVPPGTWLEVTTEGVGEGRYWNLLSVNPRRVADEQARFDELLVSATETRLVSDAPLGIFLSGGVDSAVVAALAQAESRARSTFAVGFDDTSYDEREKAREVARRLGTDHHEVVCRAEDVPKIAAYIARSADHLLADQSMIPLAKLAIEAKRVVKVVLTGDGGDELLAGYSTYRALEAARLYMRLVPKGLRAALLRLATHLPTSSEKMAASTLLSRFLTATTGDLAQAHGSWRCIWSHEEIDALLGARSPDVREWARYAEYFARAHDRSLLQRAVYADISTWLVDSILAKVDRATMATGLEARSPFLDSRLVEFAFATLLGADGRNVGKVPIRRLAAALLGPDLAATKKEGFQTPFGHWFAGPLREYVRERIDLLGAKLPGVFRGEVLHRIETEHASRRRNHDFKLWSLVALAEWCALYPELTLGRESSDLPAGVYGAATTAA